MQRDEHRFDGSGLIPVADAADSSGLHRDYVARLARTGKIHGEQRNGMWHISPTSLDSFIAAQNESRTQRNMQLALERKREYLQSTRRQCLPEERPPASRTTHPAHTPQRGFDARKKHATVVVTEMPVTAVQSAPQQAAVPIKESRTQRHMRLAKERKHEYLQSIHHPRQRRNIAISPNEGGVEHGVETYIDTRSKVAGALLKKMPVNAIQATPAYAAAPVMDLVHHASALITAFALAFGTYAFADWDTVGPVIADARDSALLVVANADTIFEPYRIARGIDTGILTVSDPSKLAAVALSVPDSFESFAKKFSTTVDTFLFGIVFSKVVFYEPENRVVFPERRLPLRPTPIIKPVAPAWVSTTTSVVSTTKAAAPTTVTQPQPQPVRYVEVYTQAPVTVANLTKTYVDQGLLSLRSEFLTRLFAMENANSTSFRSVASSGNSYNPASVAITGGTISGLTAPLPIASGGTGTSTAPAYGELLVGNSSGGFTLMATSTLGIDTVDGSFSTTSADYYTHSSTTIPKTYSTNTWTGANMFFSSTTIGAGGQTTGLTISGGATTTGNAYFAGTVGIGAAVPQAKLEVVDSSAATTTSLMLSNLQSATGTASRMTFRANDLVNATSTASIMGGLLQNYTTGKGMLAFSVLNNGTLTEAGRFDWSGYLGLGTTTPTSKLSITDAVSTAQQTIAYDGTRYTDLLTDSVGDFTINPQGDDVRLNDDNLWICTGGSCPSGTPSGTGNVVVETRLGVSTSTPVFPLTAFSSTESQVALSAGSGVAQWAFRNAGGNLYVSTTTVAGTATTTLPAVTVIGSTGYVGIGTSTPTQMLSVKDRLFVGANGASGMGTATSTFQGDIKIIGKLDVSTIDPPYTIDGVKYATYVPSMTGVKEETAMTVSLDSYNPTSGKYETSISFDDLETGSDLWLFYQITTFGEGWKELSVQLTPAFDGTVFYRKDIANNRLILSGSEAGEVSMRLTAARYDDAKWQNLRPDQDGNTEGTHVLTSKPKGGEKTGVSRESNMAAAAVSAFEFASSFASSTLMAATSTLMKLFAWFR